LQAYDGSEIIIPNGDLLSQHLINWTLSDKKRRVELLIGVGYDSDMELVRDVLKKQVDREEIMKKPEPRVYLQTFGDSSVDFRVLFWVDNYDLWIEIRNQVMFGIFKSFKENGIEIPFPQRDLHLKNIPTFLKESIKTQKEITEVKEEPSNEKTEE
jgi:small-conductance mechanosensitive channel